MQQTATKTDILNAIDDERRWWDALVARAKPEEMESIQITDDWSIRDLAAHLLSWWEWRLARLQAAASNEPKPTPPYPADLDSIDEQNAWFHEHYRNRSAQDVTSTFSGSFDQLKEIVSRFSEEELADPDRIPFLGGKALGPAIESRYFFEHVHHQHGKDIQTWMDRTERSG